MSLSGKRALITGSTSGIGLGIARAMASAGADVVISGFGEKGPHAGQRVYDPVVQALSGMTDVQADKASGRPKMET